MIKALVTGAGGFVGGHLLPYLKQVYAADRLELHCTVLHDGERARVESVAPDAQITALDLCDADKVRELYDRTMPDVVYHLAGQAYVPRSFENPWETLETNIRGTLNLLASAHEIKSPARLLIVGSADIYGSAAAHELPLTEQSPFRPTSPYSVSKIAQDMLALQYATSHKVHCIRTRPFNHIGPGQNSRFAIADWARQIAEAEIGARDPVLYVGNLTAARDFTDVRDVVAAYHLAAHAGEPGEVFNVCSGAAHTMQEILDTLVSMAHVEIQVQSDPARFRPVDIPILYGDSSRLRERTGWTARLSLQTSLQDALDECRVQLDDSRHG